MKEVARVQLENMHLLRKIAEIKSSVPNKRLSEAEHKDRKSRLKMISKAKWIESNAHLMPSPSGKSLFDHVKRSSSKASGKRHPSAKLLNNSSAASLPEAEANQKLQDIIQTLADDAINPPEPKPKKSKKRKAAKNPALTERIVVFESIISAEMPTE
jgi:hypothetical protein